jgi:hypothetical protein
VFSRVTQVLPTIVYIGSAGIEIVSHRVVQKSSKKKSNYLALAGPAMLLSTVVSMAAQRFCALFPQMSCSHGSRGDGFLEFKLAIVELLEHLDSVLFARIVITLAKVRGILRTCKRSV